MHVATALVEMMTTIFENCFIVHTSVLSMYDSVNVYYSSIHNFTAVTDIHAIRTAR
jgi:hypothetical protein